MTVASGSVRLLVDGDTYADLWVLARRDLLGVQGLRDCLGPQEITRDCRFHLWLGRDAVEFVRTNASEIVSRYPEMFGIENEGGA